VSCWRSSTRLEPQPPTLRRARSHSPHPSPAPCRNSSGSRSRRPRTTATRSRDRTSRACAYPTVPSRCAPPLSQPLVREREPRAAMIVLPVPHPHRPAPLVQHRAVLRHPVRNPRQQLRQMQRAVRVVPHPDQQHLPIHLPHPPDRALNPVRRQRQRVTHDPLRRRPEGRERERMPASPHPRHPPEQVRHRAQVGCQRRPRRVEWRVVLPGPRRHHERACGAEGVEQGRNEPGRPTLDGTHGTERGVDEQDVAGPDAEGAKLGEQGGAGGRATRLHRFRNGVHVGGHTVLPLYKHALVGFRGATRAVRQDSA
jgi:hypothetical protein